MHTQRCSHMSTCRQTFSSMCIDTLIHSLTHPFGHTRVYTHRHAPTERHTQARMQRCSHSRTHSHTQVCNHTHTPHCQQTPHSLPTHSLLPCLSALQFPVLLPLRFRVVPLSAYPLTCQLLGGRDSALVSRTVSPCWGFRLSDHKII